MFLSGLTESLFQEFTDSYQTTTFQNLDIPFVYVDEDGVRLIADVRSNEGGLDSGVLAISLATDEDMEIIAFE